MAKYVIVQFEDTVDIDVLAVSEQVLVGTIAGTVVGKMDYMTPEPVMVEHDHPVAPPQPA